MTVSADAAAKAHGRGKGVRSRVARSIALDLIEAPKHLRRTYLHTLDERDRMYVFSEAARELGTMYGLWHDDPYGFVEDVLGETQWSLQRQVTDSIALPDVKRVIVPAGFGLGKTFLAGRMVAWAGAVNPIGSIRIVTTATRMRQVRSQLWPEIKTAVAKGKLPGRTDTIQWVAHDLYGNEVQIAYGFSAPPNDEAAMQGIHGTPKLLLVVDEAGGIAPLIGKGTNNLLTGDAKMLAIGNPAMNEPGSWMEKATADGLDPEKPETITIQISSLDSPAITGEVTPICRACVPNLDGHTICNLPEHSWLFNTLEEYGVLLPRDSDMETVAAAIRESGVPYLIAKVLAEFPKDTGAQIMPSSWVEAAMTMEEPLDHSACNHDHDEGRYSCVATDLLPDYVRLCDLDLDHETDPWAVKRGSWIRLGVDVAADGGDELAIYRSVGDLVTLRHASSGNQNADAMVVAEKIATHIDEAKALAAALGTTQKVRVKIDGNGLGWGVAGALQRWTKTGRLKDVQVVKVMVSESPHKDDPAAVMRPYRKRDEMFLAGRFLLQPNPSTGFGRIRLRIDHKAKVQLSTPTYSNNAAGFVVVESKASMKKRGLSSPDRAEAALLALYEPEPITSNRRGLLTRPGG